MLERLVKESISITKWDRDGNPSWDLGEYDHRFIWLAQKIMSISGAEKEMRTLKSSQSMQVFQRALKSLKKRDKSDASAIVEALVAEVDTIRKEPIHRYIVAIPIALSLDLRYTRQEFHIDHRSVVLLRYLEFADQYLPRKLREGQQVIDAIPLEESGFDLEWASIENPAFLIVEIYARDSWQALLESETLVDLFLSVADLSGARKVFEAFPLSLYPNPTFCLVFKDPQTSPERFGRWTIQDRLPRFAFNFSMFSKMLNLLVPAERTDVWPIMKASLLAFRRAMIQTNPADSLIHFWTACEIICTLREKMHDEDVVKRLRGIFTNAWYEFALQIEMFLDLRNRALHDAEYVVEWQHIVFCRFLFDNLIAILIGYSQKGMDATAVRSRFRAARMTDDERRNMLAALQEFQKDLSETEPVAANCPPRQKAVWP